MKPLRKLILLSVIFTSSAAWSQGTGSLFNSGETNVSVFGETANGNVDSEPQQNVVHTTNTVTTSTVAAPTPAPPPPDAPRPAARRAVAADPKITRTFKSRRVVSHDRLEHNAGGGGIAFSYFITRFIGVALEGDFLGGNPYNTVLTGNLIFRYPFDFGAKTDPGGYDKDGKESKSVVTGPTWGIAPYIILGGGGQWDGHGEGVGDVGGGVELRFKQHYGVFVEGRWFIHDSRQSYAAETAGISYSF